MRVYFSNKLPSEPANVIDLSGELETPEVAIIEGKFISLTPFYIENEKVWKESFIYALGAINKNNASLYWWAYTVSAKNFLSSNLGKEVFQMLAIQSFLRSDESGLPLFVLGASSEQRKVLGRSKTYSFSTINQFFKAFVRNIYHGLRCLFFLRKSGDKTKLDVTFFSYILKPYTWGEDAFFGDLIAKLVENKLNLSIKAYLYANASFYKAELFCGDVSKCELLFYHLSFIDIIKSLWHTLSALFKPKYVINKFTVAGMEFSPLLIGHLFDDVRSGRYFFNLLVYKAIRRMVRVTSVKKIIYPYENKSLEKMILMASRSINPSIKCIGYQHSSVTPRHTTLLFSEGESRHTPLPDRIITLGLETKAYLEDNGNYPEGIFIEGCALRQTFPSILPTYNKTEGELKILLALSSSKYELLEAVKFCKEVHHSMGGVCFGIRPHPEFQLSMLPDKDIDWLQNNAKDFSQSRLEDNIFWADICVYVSSTVSLEAMLYGKPVINIRLSDVIDPDPILRQVKGVWKAFTIQELVFLLRNWEVLSKGDKKEISLQVMAYAHRYFITPTDTCIHTFMDT